MKVVHVCLNKNGGAAAAAFNLHLSLLQQGVNSWFYTLEPRGAENVSQQWICWKEGENNWWKRLLLFGRRKYWQWKSQHNLRALATLQKQYDTLLPTIEAEMVSLPTADKNFLNDAVFKDADIIHLHWVTHFVQYANFFERTTGKYALCWTLHDRQPFSGLYHYAWDEHRNPQTAILDAQVKDFRKKCMHQYGQPITAIAPNNWMLQQVQASCLAECFRPVVIPYVAASFESEPMNLSQARLQLDLDAESIMMLIVTESNTVARKQTNLIFEIAPWFPQIQFVLVGHAMANAPKAGNIRQVGFVQSRQQMHAYYAAADAVLIPSAEDNLPNVLLEAFTAGKPVLSFAVGGMQQYVVNGSTGFTTNNVSAQGLQFLIQQFLNAGKNFDRTTIQQIARQHFHPETIARQHLALYQQILTTAAP